MLAAGGLMALLLVGFVVDGMLSPKPQAAEDDDDAVGAEGPGDQDNSGDQGTDLTDFLFGSDDGDRIDAFGGDDSVVGGGGDDTIDGGDGNDTLDGGPGGDLLMGGGGDDHVILGAGDTASGGAGVDIFDVTERAENEDGEMIAYVRDFEPGIDRLILDFDGAPEDEPEILFDWESNPGSMLVLANGTPVTLLEGVVSMSQQDVEVRMSEDTAGATEDCGGDDDTPDTHVGASLMDGGTLDDMTQARTAFAGVFGPVEDDALTTAPGGDTTMGSDGNDAIFGNDGADLLLGGGGVDEIHGDTGDDTIEGGADMDFLTGGEGDDAADGGDGADRIFGEDGDDTLRGGSGDDYVQGGFGADSLDGGAGDDRLDGTYSANGGPFGPTDQDEGDTLSGGNGDDSILIGAGDIATGGEGSDTFTAGPYVEDLAVAGRVEDFDPAQDTIEVIYDPDLTPNPEITVEPDPNGTGVQVMLDGQVILFLNDGVGLDPGEITLRDVEMARAAEARA